MLSQAPFLGHSTARDSFPQEPAGKMQAHGRGWPPRHPCLSFVWGDIGGGLGQPCPPCSPGEQGDKSPCLPRWPRNGAPSCVGPVTTCPSLPVVWGLPRPAAAPTCRQWAPVPPGKVDSTSTCCGPGELCHWLAPSPATPQAPTARASSWQTGQRAGGASVPLLPLIFGGGVRAAQSRGAQQMEGSRWEEEGHQETQRKGETDRQRQGDRGRERG